MSSTKIKKQNDNQEVDELGSIHNKNKLIKKAYLGNKEAYQIYLQNEPLLNSPVTDDLIAWFKPTQQNDYSVLTDYSGNNNNGILYNINSSNFSNTDGVYLGGVDSYIDTQIMMNSFDLTGFTISAIFKGENWENYRCLIGDTPSSGLAGLNMVGYQNGQAVDGIYPPTNNVGIIRGTFNNSYLTHGINEYNEVSLTFNKSYMGLYVNGVLKGSRTPSNINFANIPVIIGRAMPLSGRYYKGYIRDMKIYNKGLTADEILENHLYNVSQGLVNL